MAENDKQVFVHAGKTFDVSTQVVDSDGVGNVTVAMFADGKKVSQRTVTEEEYASLLGANIFGEPRVVGLIVDEENEMGLFTSVALLLPLEEVVEEQEEQEDEDYFSAAANAFENSLRENEMPSQEKATLVKMGEAFRPANARKFPQDALMEAADLLNEILFKPEPDKKEVVQAIDDLLNSI